MSIQASNKVHHHLRPADIKAAQAPLQIKDGVIDTGRYEIQVTDDTIHIQDRHTNTWVQLWGDPHGVTSDGDKFQFHENVTFDLPDGTKMTVKTTPKDANGIAFIDAVAVLKGKDGVEVTGVHDGQKGVQFTSTKDVADLERRYPDGTILRVSEHGQLDDLFTRRGELVGGDASQPFGEKSIDGIGGKSLQDFSNPKAWHHLVKGHGTNPSHQPKTPKTSGGCTTGGSAPAGSPSTGTSPSVDSSSKEAGLLNQLSGASSPEEIMFLIAMLMQNKMNGVADQLKSLGEQYAATKTDPNDKSAEAKGKKLEADMQYLQFRLQQIQQVSQQFFTAATNISKSRHEAQMSVVGNFK